MLMDISENIQKIIKKIGNLMRERTTMEKTKWKT